MEIIDIERHLFFYIEAIVKTFVEVLRSTEQTRSM